MEKIFRISDGLGNQLFQYACGRAIQEMYKGELYLDIADFKINERKYSLNNFKLNENIKYIEINNLHLEIPEFLAIIGSTPIQGGNPCKSI